jgi:hypothetical protein
VVPSSTLADGILSAIDGEQGVQRPVATDERAKSTTSRVFTG